MEEAGRWLPSLSGSQILVELHCGEQVCSRPHPYVYTTRERYPARDHGLAAKCPEGRIPPLLPRF